MTTFGVIQFPGSCDDRDALAGSGRLGEARLLWHEETDLAGIDAVIVPGVGRRDLRQSLAHRRLGHIGVQGHQLLHGERPGGGKQRRFKQLREGTHDGPGAA